MRLCRDFRRKLFGRFLESRLNRIHERRKNALALVKSYGRLAPFHSPLT